MSGTDATPKKIFRVVKQIHISDIYHQAHVYFGLIGIVNASINPLPNPLTVSALTNLDGDNEIEVQH